MNWLKRRIRQVFCRHQYEFACNLYGDQIIDWGWKRSVWVCSKCGHPQGRDELHEIAHGIAPKAAQPEDKP